MPVGMIDHRLVLSVFQPADHLCLWWWWPGCLLWRNSEHTYRVTHRLCQLRDDDVRSYARGLPCMVWVAPE